MINYNRGPERVVKITKDSTLILEELAIQYPTLVIISEAAKLQRKEIGDGTASFAILVSALLEKANELMSAGLHPNTILQGYFQATRKILDNIDALSGAGHNVIDKVLETVDCGRGLLTSSLKSKIVRASQLATKNGKFDKDKVRIVKKPGGSILDSEFVEGLVVRKEKVHPNMPDLLENPAIAIISSRLGSNRLETKMKSDGPFHLNFNIKDPRKLGAFRSTEKDLKMQSLARIKSVGANVLVSEQPLDDSVRSEMVDLGIFGLETVSKEDTEAIAEATEARVIGDIADISESDIGHADRLETSKIDLEKIVILRGCKAATFVLKGTLPQSLDEAEATIKASLTVLKSVQENSKMVPGGGAIEMSFFEQLNDFAKELAGKEQLAIKGFADALLELPKCLAENNGLDVVNTIAQLKKLHSGNSGSYGIGLEGCVDSVCLEPVVVKKAMIKRAYEVVSMLLKIDEQVMSREIPKFHKQ